MFFSISLPAIAPPAPRRVTAGPFVPTVWSLAPPGAPAPPASSRTSTVRMDSTVPHKAQLLLAGTDLRSMSGDRTSLCLGQRPLCIQPVTATAPIRPAIRTGTARPAKRVSIRIYPGIGARSLQQNSFPPSPASRRNRPHLCNPRANIGSCANSTSYRETRIPGIFNASLVNDGFPRAGKTELMGKEICCRPGATTRRIPRARISGVSALFGLEHLRLELVALEQLVELRAIALRELRRPGHAAAGDTQDPDQIFALERSPRFLEGRELRGLLLQRLLDQRSRHNPRRAERNRLFDHVAELPHVARPRRCEERLKPLRRHCLDVLSVARGGDLALMGRQR